MKAHPVNGLHFLVKVKLGVKECTLAICLYMLPFFAPSLEYYVHYDKMTEFTTALRSSGEYLNPMVSLNSRLVVCYGKGGTIPTKSMIIVNSQLIQFGLDSGARGTPLPLEPQYPPWAMTSCNPRVY